MRLQQLRLVNLRRFRRAALARCTEGSCNISLSSLYMSYGLYMRNMACRKFSTACLNRVTGE